jgi:hypothetical protein
VIRPAWRVGRSLGRTLYVGDTFVGVVDTPKLAAAIVEAMNGRPDNMTCGFCGTKETPQWVDASRGTVICQDCVDRFHDAHHTPKRPPGRSDVGFLGDAKQVQLPRTRRGLTGWAWVAADPGCRGFVFPSKAVAQTNRPDDPDGVQQLVKVTTYVGRR